MIRKAVFPVAGLGTRVLPATKAIAKEMMPIIDRPIIQYATDEAVRAGITDLIFVVSRVKNSIQDHYDKAYELESELEKKGKIEQIKMINSIVPEGVNCSYVRQPEALGLGHAIFCARSLVGDEPFAVILPDDLIDDGNRGCLKQMVDVHDKYGGGVIAVENVPREFTSRYGIVSTEILIDEALRITGLVEKPSPKDAPTTLSVVGRYILPAGIFPFLENLKHGAGGELQLTDAIANMLDKETYIAHEFEGRRFDCGSRGGLLQATLNYAAKDPQLREELKQFMNKLN